MLPSGVAAPGKAASEGAGDYLGNHPCAGIIIFPTCKQPPSGYVRAVGSSSGYNQDSDSDASGNTVQLAHAVLVFCFGQKGWIAVRNNLSSPRKRGSIRQARRPWTPLQIA